MGFYGALQRRDFLPCTVRGLNLNFFGISIGIKWKMIDTFCKMFGNVLFFSHLHLKFAKSAIMTQKIFS
jgi:hypothetical protein